MNKSLIAICIATCSLGLTSNATAVTRSITASGSFACHGRDAIYPIAGARVDIMDADVFDQVIGTGVTDENGDYSIKATGGDLTSGPDVYPRLFLTTEAGHVSVGNSVGRVFRTQFRSPISDIEKAVSLGNIVVGTEGESSECGLFIETRKVFLQFLAENGKLPPFRDLQMRYGAINGGTPWTALNTIQWPVGFSNAEDNVEHEFGHAIRHSINGMFAFPRDAIRFGYARNHEFCDHTNKGFAFNEGWAEYYANDYKRCGGPDMDYEGNVAGALKKLSACPDIGGRKKMVEVLAAHPRQIYSYEEFEEFAIQMHPNCSSLFFTTPSI